MAATEGQRPARGQAAGRACDAANGLRGRGKRRSRVPTTDSIHTLPVATNLLARNFTVAATNTVCAGDMTYISTGEGWLYLTMVLDLVSRIVG